MGRLNGLRVDTKDPAVIPICVNLILHTRKNNPLGINNFLPIRGVESFRPGTHQFIFFF